MSSRGRRREPALGVSVDDGALDTHRVEDRHHRVDVGLQRQPHRAVRDRITDPGAEHVELNDPAHLGEPVEEADGGRLVPDRVEVGDRTGDEHDVPVPRPEHLVDQVVARVLAGHDDMVGGPHSPINLSIVRGTAGG